MLLPLNSIIYDYLPRLSELSLARGNEDRGFFITICRNINAVIIKAALLKLHRRSFLLLPTR
jgi:hypothetical protein